MLLILFHITLIISFLDFYSPVSQENRTSTYYVSPTGKDSNSGTVGKPWRSFGKALESLKAGETLIVEDGNYIEYNPIKFSHSGTNMNPITIIGKNKHKAIVTFAVGNIAQPKINILNKRNIVIKNLTITQANAAKSNTNNNTLDIIIACRNSFNCSFVGNKIYGSFEEGIKVSKSDNITIENNLLSNFQHEGIDVLNVSNVIIKDNVINEVGRVGIMVKGGSRNVQVIGNSIANRKMKMVIAGITVGGETDRYSTFNSNTGYEAYNIVAFNNKVTALSVGKITNGIAFMGAKESYAFNNTIVGADYGILFMTVKSKKNGWRRDTPNSNIEVKNNIVMNIRNDAYLFKDLPTKLQSDYNLFYSNGSSPKEINSYYGNPNNLVMNSESRVSSTSSVKFKGSPVPKTFNGFNGSKIIIRSDLRSFHYKFGANE